MTGKILGIPLIAVILVLAIVLPNLISDVMTRNAVKSLEQTVIMLERANVPTVAPEPTVTPTETLTPTKAVRQLRSATGSAQ